MTSASDQADDQAFSAFDRDRHLRHVASLDELGKFAEQLHELVLGVLNQPSLDNRALVIDEAHRVHGRAPVRSTEHLLTSRPDIAAGAGPTVGSSLFGPHRGCSLAPIRGPGNDEGDQLKQAIEWRDIEAVPRRSRRTDQPGLPGHTRPMRQRPISLLVLPSASRRSM
ncbi:hypothetical protein [Janibacter terrae]|uniref:hypothetical protein n=1 Tax=Janibacter sp. LM TaxID=3144845 RepID=UPI000B249BAC|nr:hypothetical protein [Janibacter terrae]